MTTRAPFELRSYQEQGIDFLMSGGSCLLADEMGLGKTVQVAVALSRMRAAGELRRALIVCPASLLLNWQRELARFGPDCAVRSTSHLDDDNRRWLYRLPIPVTITSYESLRTDFLPVSPADAFDVVVFDEAQRLKNRESTTALAARRVPAKHRWLLSATPLENRVEDLGSLAEVLRIMAPVREHLGDAALVREAFQGHFLRRRKQDVLPELPAMIRQELPLEMKGGQRLEYDESAYNLDRAGSFADILALITRLKLICNRSTEGESVKLEALRVILDDPDVDPIKLIVVSQFTSTLEWLAEQLTVETHLYSGDLSSDQRDDSLRAFRESSKPGVLLLSLKAGGVGLNIVEASHVLLFDRWWAPASEEQAVARAHRFGRSAPLTVYSFRVVDSVEDRIVEVARSKAALFDELVEGELSGDAEIEGWSRRELLRVLEPTT